MSSIEMLDVGQQLNYLYFLNTDTISLCIEVCG